MSVLQILILCLVLTKHSSDGAKILGVFNIPSKSHHILGESLLKGLAAKGHDVTMVSPFSSTNLPMNYEELVVEDILRIKEAALSAMMLDFGNMSTLSAATKFIYNSKVVEDAFLRNRIIQNLISSQTRYDLAIVTWFGNDATLALAQHLAKYTVVFSIVGSSYFITKLTNVPAPPAYVPNIFPSFPDEMNFFERFLNTITSVAYCAADYVYAYHERSLIEKYFPNVSSTHKLYEHISLILLNTHYSLESRRPYVPQMIQIGGLHLEEPKELNKDLKQFMDQAQEGVILFSLGSNIKSSDLHKHKLQELIRSFSKLPYKVLWKFESDDIPNLPGNIKISKWLPQRDLLAHKNLKLFITHGGLLSTTEAIHNGVPMIGIPIFGDQYSNVNEGVVKGYLVKISYSDLSEATLTSAITEVMNNPIYRNNVQERSRIFRDRPLKPLDKAIYWVEYVLRHNGAHHLKTSAYKLNWFQQCLLDIVAFILFIIFCFVYVIRKTFSFIFVKKSSKQVGKIKKKSKAA